MKKCLFVSSGCIYNRFIMSCHEQVCLIMFNVGYYFERYFFHHWTIVDTSPFYIGGLSLQPDFQRWGVLDRTSAFRWMLLGKRGVTFFRAGLQFSHKNKLKSESFNDEKNYKQKYFSVIQIGKIYLRI